MSEIKFRGWDKKENRMREIVLIDLRNRQVLVETDESEECDLLDFCEVELMQFTGLRDKNGREIYEGDIVRGAGIKPKVYVVGWLDTYGGFAFLDDEKAIPAYEFLNDFCEVIGNIYENPELLREADAE